MGSRVERNLAAVSYYDFLDIKPLELISLKEASPEFICKASRCLEILNFWIAVFLRAKSVD